MPVICNFPTSKDLNMNISGSTSSKVVYDSRTPQYYVEMYSNFSYDKENNRIVISTRLHEQYLAGQRGSATNYIYLG